MTEYKHHTHLNPDGESFELYEPSSAHLYLRDVFNPLCLAFAKKVQAVDVANMHPDLVEILNGDPKLHTLNTYREISEKPLHTVPIKRLPSFREFIHLGNYSAAVIPRFGYRFSTALVQATYAMQYLFKHDARTNMDREVDHIKEHEAEILQQGVFWGNHVGNTISEGFLSVAQTFVLLMATDIGEDDPLRLSTNILQNGLIESFALRTPLNLLGLMSRSQSYFPFPAIERSPDGKKLQLTDELEMLLRNEKNAFMAKNAKRPPYGIYEMHLAQAGKGCPAARGSTDEETGQPYNGARVIAEIMLPYLRYYYETMPENFLEILEAERERRADP